jgi:hypothetical protein
VIINEKNPRTVQVLFGDFDIWLIAVGFFIARPSRIVEMHAKHSFAPFLLALWGIASRKRHTLAFSLAHPRPPPEVFESKAGQHCKKKTTLDGWFSFCVITRSLIQ